MDWRCISNYGTRSVKVPSFSITTYPVNRVTWSWNLSQLTLGKQCSIPRTSCQFVTGLPYRDKPTSILELPIYLTCMYLDCGRKPEYPERNHLATRRTWKHALKDPALAGSQPNSSLGPSCCAAAVLGMAPLCCHSCSCKHCGILFKKTSLWQE